MIEILVAVALIWLLVKAIGWLLAFIVALLSKFFAISINVIKIFFLGFLIILILPENTVPFINCTRNRCNNRHYKLYKGIC